MSETQSKLVTSQIMFLKPGLEHAFSQTSITLSQAMDSTQLNNQEKARVLRELGQASRPPGWLEASYPPGASGDLIGAIPAEDQRYIQVNYQVVSRFPDSSDGAAPSRGVKLPAGGVLVGRLDPTESSFGDEFFHFPEILGRRPSPGRTTLTGFMVFQFEQPQGDIVKFTHKFVGVGTDDEIQWGGGQQYRFHRDRCGSIPGLPGPNGITPLDNGGTLNLKTGEISDLAVNAAFQNSLIAEVDRLNRIAFAFPYNWPPLPVPPEAHNIPGFEDPFTQAKAWAEGSFQYDQEGNITGFAFRGESIEYVTIFPFLPGLFPRFSFGQHGKFVFANPTAALPGTPEANVPNNVNNTDGLPLSTKVFFHPHFELVTERMTEFDPQTPFCPHLPENCANGAMVAANGKLHFVGGRTATGPANHLWIWDGVSPTWTVGAPMPEALEGIAAVALGNSLVVAGGRNAAGTSVKRVSIFDLASGSWSAGPDLPHATAFPAFEIYQDKMFVIGGYDANGDVSDKMCVFDGTGWTESTIVLPVAEASANANAGGIAVIGGRLADGTVTNRTSVWRPTEGWSVGMPSGIAVCGAAGAFEGERRIFLVGGRNNAGITQFLNQQFEFGDFSWRPGMLPIVPSSHSGVAVLNNRLYIAGGYSQLAWDEAPGQLIDTVQALHLTMDWRTNPDKPVYFSGGVLNPAGGIVCPRPISPGGRSLLTTTHPGTGEGDVLQDPNAADPTKLAGLTVLIDGRKAPVLHVGPAGIPGMFRVDFICPPDLDPGGDMGRIVDLQLQRDGVAKQADPMRVLVTPTSPGVFCLSFGNLFEPAYLTDSFVLGINGDGTMNCAKQPEVPGGMITLLATGLGAAAQGGQADLAQFSIDLNGHVVAVQGVELVPDQPALATISFQIPSDYDPGKNLAHNLSLIVAGAKSNPVRVAIGKSAPRENPPITKEEGFPWVFGGPPPEPAKG